MGNKKAILLLSGGIDSTTLLAKLSNENYEVIAVSFYYGQKHEIEINYAKKNKLLKKAPAKHLFDKFYVDYTKIYPLSGGMTDTMKKSDILKKNQVIVLEGSKELGELFSKGIPKNIKFLDILFCLGGCIGGSEVNSKKSLKQKDKLVRDYLKAAKHEKVGTRLGKVKQAKGVKFTTPKDYVSTSCLKITKRR